MERRLQRMRDLGWSVAVHNDYRLNKKPMTFWLFTHQDGPWVKGEGSTDKEALDICLASADPRGLINEEER